MALTMEFGLVRPFAFSASRRAIRIYYGSRELLIFFDTTSYYCWYIRCKYHIWSFAPYWIIVIFCFVLHRLRCFNISIEYSPKIIFVYSADTTLGIPYLYGILL